MNKRTIFLQKHDCTSEIKSSQKRTHQILRNHKTSTLIGKSYDTEILPSLNIIKQVNKDRFQKEGIKNPKKLIKQHKNWTSLGPKWESLDNQSMEIIVYSDGSFIDKNGSSYEVLVIIFIADQHERAYIRELKSVKSRWTSQYDL